MIEEYSVENVLVALVRRLTVDGQTSLYREELEAALPYSLVLWPDPHFNLNHTFHIATKLPPPLISKCKCGASRWYTQECHQIIAGKEAKPEVITRCVACHGIWSEVATDRPPPDCRMFVGCMGPCSHAHDSGAPHCTLCGRAETRHAQ